MERREVWTEKDVEKDGVALESRKKKGSPLRVIQACDLQAGGIASLILAVCEHLDREKVNFDYLVYRNREEFGEKKALKMGGRKLVADNAKARYKTAKFLWKFFHTWQVLRKEKAIIFHINASTPYDCLVGIAARLAGVEKVILHSHSSKLKKPGKGFMIFQGICRLLIPVCGDYYFACSDLAGEFLFGKRCRKKVIYVNNGISVEDFQFDEVIRRKMRKQYQLEGTLVVGSIGRLCKVKNQEFLLEIFAELLKLHSGCRFLLIGRGELEGELMKMADTLQIREKLIHISVTDRIREYLCMMDVFLLPSLSEGFPVVGVEAQGCGLPCIFSGSITKQVALTDRAYFLGLEYSASEWAKFTLEIAGKGLEERETYMEKVREAGYDIQDTASWLQKFYLQVAGTECQEMIRKAE